MYIPIINRFTVLPKQLPAKIIDLRKANMKPIIDYSVETKNNSKDNFYEIQSIQKRFPNSTYAIKPSGLMYSDMEDTYNSLHNIANTAQENSNRILIDAEDVSIQPHISYLTNKLIENFNTNEALVYKTYQMYRKDSLYNLKHDIDSFNANNKKIGLKIVRGAYHRNDVSSGLLFEKIEDTHESYNKSIELIFNSLNLDESPVIWATHNQASIDYVKSINNSFNFDKKNIIFSQLLGMSDEISKTCVDEGYTVMKYIPYGPIHKTLPYLLRRLNENKYMVKYIL